MRSVTLTLAAAVLFVLAFPPFSQAWLVPIALALYLEGVSRSPHPFWTGALFGWTFFAGLIWWVGKLGLIAVAPLVIAFGLYPGLLGLVIKRFPQHLFATAVGGWAAMEAIRVRFPVGGFEWGLAGYPLADYALTRAAAPLIGTTGWGVLLVALAAGLVLARRGNWRPLAASGGLILMTILVAALVPQRGRGEERMVAIVQGSTPCPLEHCLHERLLTLEQHLALTRLIPAAGADLVVWAEGSTGSFDADPILVPEVAKAIGAEATRIGADFLVGGDRPLSDTEWVNALVAFDPSGSIVGQYLKRHPVPFGEYIPARPLFDWIPALSQVPRDMIPGDEVGVFDLGSGTVGTVISFEGNFARYGRDAAKNGAELLVVATNTGSYEFTSASDQFFQISRMRSAELGLDVVHAAVTGKSSYFTDGGVHGETIEFLEQEVLYGTVHLATGPPTLYTRLGEWIQGLAVVAGAAGLFRHRLSVRR
ncbi:MAG: apolipoprotein N-acyltransferase [Actinobacteria bacterium]|nr:apolipoprotein N-acyltransferase [Actinomycetota bacterium]